MAGGRVVVREISWRDLLPWLIIFRTFGLAKSAPVLLLGTVGALLTPVGWYVGEALFVTEDSLVNATFREDVEANRVWPSERGALPVPNKSELPDSVWDIVRSIPDNVRPVFQRFVGPVRRLLNNELPLTHAAYYAFGSLWMLLVWGFFGGAITRIAAVQLGREERIGMVEAMRHAARNLGAYIGSPLFPLLGVVLTAVPMFLVGLLMHFDWGVLVVGILWLLLALGGLIITVLLLGLLFGWPLMWMTISSERNGDAFEAFSRSYSYTFQRPLHYLFYAVVATFFGGLVWLLVYHFTEAVIDFTEWPIAMAAGSERWSEIASVREHPAASEPLLYYGSSMIGWLNGLIRSFATGLAYSFFWCLAAAIYLLLRRDVDHTEFDEVYVADDLEDEAAPENVPEETASTESPETDKH